MIEGGVEASSSPTSSNLTTSEILFDIVDTLCGRFMGMTPFEVMNAPLEDVMDLYADSVLHEKRKKKGKSSEGEWVTSKTASWH
jgi:hypothetical protein